DGCSFLATVAARSPGLVELAPEPTSPDSDLIAFAWSSRSAAGPAGAAASIFFMNFGHGPFRGANAPDAAPGEPEGAESVRALFLGVNTDAAALFETRPAVAVGSATTGSVSADTGAAGGSVGSFGSGGSSGHTAPEELNARRIAAASA